MAPDRIHEQSKMHWSFAVYGYCTRERTYHPTAQLVKYSIAISMIAGLVQIDLIDHVAWPCRDQQLPDAGVTERIFLFTHSS